MDSSVDFAQARPVQPHRVCLPFFALLACQSPASTSDTDTTDGAGTTSAANGTTTQEPTTEPALTGSTSSSTTSATTTSSTDTGSLTSTSETGDTSESCDTCAPLPCPKEGGVYCGGNGVGGDPNTLYVCQGGALQVLEDCGEMCSWQPLGVPDRCPGEALDVPASLIDLLDAEPYVEQDCTPTEYDGWPYEAYLCKYTTQGVDAEVTIANPSPDRVGAWIVDAATYIPALAALRDVDAAAYEEGLKAIGLHMLYQSSRIFPLTGDIIEDLGNGPELFPFNDGVSDPCGTGCYCRINSLHRTEWCAYQESLGTPYDTCIAAIGDSGHTPEWAGHCLDNHIAAWTSEANDHFRAKAFIANQSVSATCPPDACSPAAVVDAVQSAYGL